MNKGIAARVACGVAAVSLMLSACGGSANSAPNGAKVLIEGTSTDANSLDPMNATDNASWRVARQVYDNLVGYKPGTFDPIPSLATSWTTSGDGETWTFTLRQGVKFQDGTDFNADAVVFNVDRWWDKSDPYHTGEFADFPSFFGGFKGDPNSLIAGVKALDAYHLQVTLKEVFPEFLARMMDISTGIVSPAAIKKYGKEIGRHPVGTGPFEFQKWTPGDSITLVKNPTYWEGGLPKLGGLVFKVIPDNTARLGALRSGELDLMTGLNPSDAASVTGNSQLQLISRPPINTGFFWFNTSKAPFDKVKVRQALSMAVNKQGLVDAFFKGEAIQATTILSPSSWAYNSKIQGYAYNPDAARKLLAEAGYPNGFTTQLWIQGQSRPYFPEPLQVAQSMQADFAKIGVKVSIMTYDGASYSSHVYGAEFPGMASWGTSGSDPDPGLVLDHYFDDAYATPPTATDSGLYKNATVSELLRRAGRTLDRGERTTLYQQAQQIIHDDAAVLPIAHSKSLIAAAAYVKNYVPFAEYYESYGSVSIQK